MRNAYTIGQFAKLTGQSREAVKSQVRRGKLPAVSTGPKGWRLITLKALEGSPLWESILRRAQLMKVLGGSSHVRP